MAHCTVEAVGQFPDAWKPWALRSDCRTAQFASDGTTVAALLAYAASLRALVERRERGSVIVCVATEDRLDVAAAFLAALQGGPLVVLPHAFSAPALNEVYATRPFTHWIGPAEWVGQIPGTRIEPPGATTETGPTPDSFPWANLGTFNADAMMGWVFTGGSTGRPKLWPKNGRQLLAESAMLVNAFGIGPEDRVLATVSPCHIYGLLHSVIVPLLSGSVAERVAPFSPREIGERIAKTGSTVLVSTPAHLRFLAQLPWCGPTIRTVLSSGAPLQAEDAIAFHARSGRWVHEIYGSSETGGIATRTQADANTAWTPLPGVEWRIVDGCIAVRSEYVGTGVPLDDQGYYLTADGVRANGGGRFELLGRTDGVVKVGGKRVDLRSVEEKLRALGGVTDAVVVARPDGSARGHQILALVESALPAAAILAALREGTPSSAWPRALRCVEHIPVTAAGKTDRDAVERLLSLVPDGDEVSATDQGFRARLLRHPIFVRALEREIDASRFRRRPSPRMTLGLVLIGSSYIVAWPSMLAWSVVVVWLRRPLWAVWGPPVLYALSWVMFTAGMALVGPSAARDLRDLTHLGLRWVAARFLTRSSP